MSGSSPRRLDAPPDASGGSWWPERRSLRRIGRVLSFGMPVLTALGTIHAQAGCGGWRVCECDVAEVRTPPPPVMMSGREVLEPWWKAWEKECIPVLIEVNVEGSYTRFHASASPGRLYGPALVLHASVQGGGRLMNDIPYLGNLTVTLSEPLFAAEFSAHDLCATKEATPSHLRFECLGHGGKTVAVEYRVEKGHELWIKTESGDTLGDDETARGHVVEMAPNACLTLHTDIPNRDLTPIRKVYRDDGPSDRCRTSTAPRRKVPATFVHEMLPKGHASYEYGQPTAMPGFPQRTCRASTQVRLVLPPAVGPSVDLGLLHGQCDMCQAVRLDDPNGAYAQCVDSRPMSVYQLGDHLHVVEGASVRQVPLPCGVELDFQMRDFAARLSL